MKKILFIPIVLLLCSCGFVKLTQLANNQKITIKQDSITFKVENNRVLLKDDVNFLLDIGAANVLFANKINNFKIKDSLSIGSLETATGEELENKSLVLDSISNRFFTIKEAVFRKMDKKYCFSSYGLLGPETFENQTIAVNFEKNKIYKANADQLKDYEKLKVSDFDGYFFYIDVLINNVKTSVKLDTGNPNDLVLSNKDFNKIQNNKFYSFHKNSDSTTNSLANLKMNNYSDSILIKSTPKIKRNLLGVGFMKNYNWILDYKNGNVYAKKISKNQPKYFLNKAFIENDILFYGETYQKEKKEYLGKEIISVNQIKVNPENICEMQNLLNQTEDWNLLKLTFK
ncbi:hypothetical protein [Kaistella sp.]|uniref:hypothetical protein n=1 Tax=Kaistella sp. TaxID=2782235 RepID=UPI003C4844E1